MPDAPSAHAALEKERATLVLAERDIAEGQVRIEKQRRLVAAFTAGTQDRAQAERLLGLLETTLIEWEKHRTLILQRIAHLESRQALEPGHA